MHDENRECLFCGKDSTFKDHIEPRHLNTVHCPRCGVYHVSDSFLHHPVLGDRERQWRVCCMLVYRRLQGFKSPLIFNKRPDKNSFGPNSNVVVMQVEDLEEQFPRQLEERLDKSLLNLSAFAKDNLGQSTEIDVDDDWAFLFAKNRIEVIYIVQTLVDAGWIRELPPHGTKREVVLTGAGLSRIRDIKRSADETNSQNVFVAMWFDPSMDEVYDNGFARAITNCGLTPRRVDRTILEDKIDEEILIAIRGSRLVVADCTGGRPAVYFEAGYALGIGRKIVWTCRNDAKEIERLCFDTRQFQHLLWDDPGHLAKKLEVSLKYRLNL